jgi:hypothetical protein
MHINVGVAILINTLLLTDVVDSKKYPDIILEGGKQTLLFFSGRKVRIIPYFFFHKKNYSLLKGPSHQIRLAQKWYG